MDVCLRIIRQGKLLRGAQTTSAQLSALQWNARQPQHGPFVQLSSNPFSGAVRKGLRDAGALPLESAGEFGNVEELETVDFQRLDAEVSRPPLAQSFSRIQALPFQHASPRGGSRARGGAGPRSTAKRNGKLSLHLGFHRGKILNTRN